MILEPCTEPHWHTREGQRSDPRYPLLRPPTTVARALDIVRALLPPLRDHSQDPGMVWARQWRDREARIEAAGPCGMCQHHAKYPATMPLLPHLFGADAEGVGGEWHPKP